MKKAITIFVLMFVSGLANAQFAGGTGTSSDPFQITTAAELNLVRNYLGSGNSGKYFKVMNDISLTSYLASGGEGYTLWGGSGWSPIGAEFNEFYGQFDGNNHKISGLKISLNTSYVGLFGSVKNSGTLHNLGVEIDPAGSVTGHLYVGAIVGQNYGSLNYCYATGAVNGGFSSDMLIGGLVGQNDGYISNCYSTGAVSGSWSVGGLVGYNHTGTISNCYARGSVSTGGNLGGLVGANGGTISNCYAT